MSFLYGTCAELIFQNNGDYTAYASSAVEGSLISGGNNLQPAIPALMMDQGGRGVGKAFRLEASGIFSNTGTPTLIFQVRVSSTAGSATLSGTSVAQSAAITTASGVSNVHWWLWCNIVVKQPGVGTGNTTVNGFGAVESPAGFASPFKYMMVPTSGSPQTWTATLDDTLNYFVNLSATWSASSSSNTATCKDVKLYGLN